MIVIFFTSVAPSALAADLSRLGFEVYECIAVSEVLALASLHPAAQIVITSGVDTERAAIVREHYPTLHLNPDASVSDLIWELDLRVPRSPAVH